MKKRIGIKKTCRKRTGSFSKKVWFALWLSLGLISLPLYGSSKEEAAVIKESMQQNCKITGNVIDDSGEVLPSASVRVKDSTIGTIKEGFSANMTVTAADMNIDFILDERAREMAGEYVRWTDIKRTHKLIEYATKYNEDGIPETSMIGPDGKYKILRPIPQAAIDLNQAEVKQNPGF